MAEEAVCVGVDVVGVSQKIEATERACSRCRKEYRGVRFGPVRRLREVGEKDSWVKKLMASLSLDGAILEKVSWDSMSAVRFACLGDGHAECPGRSRRHRVTPRVSPTRKRGW